MPVRRPDSRPGRCVTRSDAWPPQPRLAPLPRTGAGGMPCFPPLPHASHAGIVRVCRACSCASGSPKHPDRAASSCRADQLLLPRLTVHRPDPGFRHARGPQCPASAAKPATCSDFSPVLLEVHRPVCGSWGSPAAAGSAWLELRRRLLCRPQRLHCARPALASSPPSCFKSASPGASRPEPCTSCASSWGRRLRSMVSVRCAARRSAASLPRSAAAARARARARDLPSSRADVSLPQTKKEAELCAASHMAEKETSGEQQHGISP